MNMARSPSPSIAQATDCRVRQTATAAGPARPENQTWTPRKGGDRNPKPAPSLAHHATLTGRCLKTTITWPSPCVSGPMRSDFFKPAERPGDLSDLRQTYPAPAPDHTTTDELSRGSRRVTTYTKDSTPLPLPKPDAPAPGMESPNEGQAASLPKPKIST
jgi:hypothetical protein